MSSSSVATQQDVSEEQSVALVRNLMRVTFSNVLYMRGIFEPDQFKPMNVGGITVQTIASESLHPNAKQVVEWMDNGVFDALKLGFLDKCVLVISADPEEKSTIEAWSLTVGWNNELRVRVNNEERVLNPNEQVQPKGPISQQQVLKVSAVMLRSLLSVLQTMPMLPDSFWLGLKLTYREGTPSDYEPAGFVKSSNGLKFATQPIRLGVGPNIRTRHNSLGVDLYAEEAEGLESCDHIGQHIPTGGWGIDLSRLGPRTSQGDDTRQASSEEDKVVAEASALYDNAVDFARGLKPGATISAKQLQQTCSSSAAAAEQMLQLMEKAGLVSTWRPDIKSRVVLQEPELEDETCMSQTSGEDEAEASAGRRSAASTPVKATTPAKKATPSSRALQAGRGGLTPHTTPHTAAVVTPAPVHKRKASRTSEAIEFGSAKRPRRGPMGSSTPF